jgi:chromosome segregation ATPase
VLNITNFHVICQEIKQLHTELAEVEEEKKGLELELRSAWDNYKTAQEKAAAVEGDLQDELRQVLRAKDQERQQAVVQITKLSEDVAAAMRQVATAQSDRDEAIQRLSAADQVNSGWATQVQKLSEELQEARSSTVQGVQNLREELRASHAAAEQMRHDHHSVVRQNQARLAQLEAENSEATRLLAASQRKIATLEASGVSGEDTPGPTDYLSRDYQTVQQEVIRLSAAVEGEQELRLDAERRAKQLEFEARATLLNMEDERRRNADALREMAAQTAVLEDKLRDIRRSGEARAGGVFSSSLGAYETNESGLGSNDEKGGQDEPRGEDFLRRVEAEAAEAREQARNLSQLLLKKQSMVVELQAERSALKARCLDLQARCSKAEQGLSSLRDMEDGGAGDDFHEQTGPSSSSGGAGLQRRGTSGGLSTKGGADTQSSRVMSDLEKMGVKPGARVATAVNWIDSWALLTGRCVV